MTTIAQLEVQIRNKVKGFCLELFDYLEVTPTNENIIFDYCKYEGNFIEAEFYVKNVEKFNREIFNEVVDFLEMPGEVKLEKRRNEKNQRIYVKFADSEIG